MDDMNHGTACNSSLHVTRRERFRKWMPTASTPMWVSRATYMWSVRRWAASAEFAAAKQSLGVCMSPATFVGVIRVMAQYADHGSGRCVAVSRARIASAIERTDRTVTTAWRLLRASGLGVEVQRGHGSDRTPGFGRRPSVYNLVSKKPAHSARGVDFHLPRSGQLRPVSPVPAEEKNSRKRRGWIEYPFEVQQLARGLAPLLDGFQGMSGTVCAAIVQSGLDTSVWTADYVRNALSAFGQPTWISKPTNHFGYLKYRLSQLPKKPVITPIPNHYVKEERIDPPASAEHRAAMMRQMFGR